MFRIEIYPNGKDKKFKTYYRCLHSIIEARAVAEALAKRFFGRRFMTTKYAASGFYKLYCLDEFVGYTIIERLRVNGIES